MIRNAQHVKNLDYVYHEKHLSSCMGLKVVKCEQAPETLYLFCQPCSKLVYLFKTPSKCLFWVWDGWVSETAPVPGLYEPLLACLCAGFPRSTEHFPLLLPECDTFNDLSMIIPNSGSYNVTVQKPQHGFKSKAKILLKMIIVWRGGDWRLLSFFSCWLALDSLMVFSVFPLESVCGHSPPLPRSTDRNAAAYRLHQKGARECEYDGWT